MLLYIFGLLDKKNENYEINYLYKKKTLNAKLISTTYIYSWCACNLANYHAQEILNNMLKIIERGKLFHFSF
jgi:hypothetical protein